jgi:hypothetical protein
VLRRARGRAAARRGTCGRAASGSASPWRAELELERVRSRRDGGGGRRNWSWCGTRDEARRRDGGGRNGPGLGGLILCAEIPLLVKMEK